MFRRVSARNRRATNRLYNMIVQKCHLLLVLPDGLSSLASKSCCHRLSSHGAMAASLYLCDRLPSSFSLTKLHHWNNRRMCIHDRYKIVMQNHVSLGLAINKGRVGIWEFLALLDMTIFSPVCALLSPSASFVAGDHKTS